MKTLEQIKNEYNSEVLDGRDLTRLSQFLPFDMLEHFELSLREGVTTDEWNADVKEFTRENILIQLEKDVEFGFEKCIDERGISAGLMYEVVKMWNWILEEGLEDFDNYGWYGRPMFEVTAKKYNFNIPS